MLLLILDILIFLNILLLQIVKYVIDKICEDNKIQIIVDFYNNIVPFDVSGRPHVESASCHLLGSWKRSRKVFRVTE